MKKPEPTWKEYKFRFSDMQLTIIDGPGADWVCVLTGSRNRGLRPRKDAGRRKSGHGKSGKAALKVKRESLDPPP